MHLLNRRVAFKKYENQMNDKKKKLDAPTTYPLSIHKKLLDTLFKKIFPIIFATTISC